MALANSLNDPSNPCVRSKKLMACTFHGEITRFHPRIHAFLLLVSTRHIAPSDLGIRKSICWRTKLTPAIMDCRLRFLCAAILADFRWFIRPAIVFAGVHRLHDVFDHVPFLTSVGICSGVPGILCFQLICYLFFSSYFMRIFVACALFDATSAKFWNVVHSSAV